jgi:hypothetical protein
MEDDLTGSPGSYAGFQLARALAAAEHADPSIRERAAKRARQWTSVLRGGLDGSISTGLRTPVKDTPAWATLEVATGGFATGALLAGGPLKAHEHSLRDEVAADAPDSDVRLALNSFFLTDEGLKRLQSLLASGRFDIDVPEEGALLVVAWLVQAGKLDDAWALIRELTPWFSRLRFYPSALPEARAYGERLWVDDVATVAHRLRAVSAKPQILAQKEAIGIWAPIHDRMVGLFLETVAGGVPVALRTTEGAWQRSDAGKFIVEGGWPCAHYPEGWRERASELLRHVEQARSVHRLCKRPEREGDSFATLHEGLQRCVEAPQVLSGKEVGRIRLVLARYVAKRGLPQAPEREALRQQQRGQAGAATFDQIARQIAARLDACRADEGLEDVAPFVQSIDTEEAMASGISAGTPVPPSLRRKVDRARKGTAAELVERGTISSGDVLAQILPQWTAALRAAEVADPALRRLHAALYRAFRRRRSLLLVNLARQVKLAELPWVSVIEGLFEDNPSSRRAAKQALIEASQLAFAAFPQAILPNKLLQELRALNDAAGLELPLVEEVAADIFMGRFAPKFLLAAKAAANAVQASLYARYYGIDAPALAAMPVPVPVEKTKARWDGKPDALATLCVSRAGVTPGAGGAARNGMVLEQAQILTTHNLAVLFSELGLSASLQGQLPNMARKCFSWVCRQLQIPVARRHARLIQIKKSAYAWRQMVFFLSLCNGEEVDAFMAWAKAHLNEQAHEFRRVFAPALSGLAAVAAGQANDEGKLRVQPFLGWSEEKHWLLPDVDSTR